MFCRLGSDWIALHFSVSLSFIGLVAAGSTRVIIGLCSAGAMCSVLSSRVGLDRVAFFYVSIHHLIIVSYQIKNEFGPSRPKSDSSCVTDCFPKFARRPL